MSGHLATARVHACALAQLETHAARVVALPSPDGRPREALIVLDEQGKPRAYRNLCRHLPVPLQARGRNDPPRIEHDGELECRTHGARYRLRDGLCIAGPCRGSELYALELELRDGELFVLVDDVDR